MIALVDGTLFAIVVIEQCIVVLYRNAVPERQSVKAASPIFRHIKGRDNG